VDSRPGSAQLCHVLVEDPDLAEAVPRERRDQAVERCVVPTLSLPMGRDLWRAVDALAVDALGADGTGFLVLTGLMIRRVGIDGRFGVELIGEGDVLRPWQPEDAPTLPLEGCWSVLEPTRLAVLDGNFTRLSGEFPELSGRLFERAIRRSRRLVANIAIIHQARVDDRLHMLFWHLAARWGRVRGDGTLLPLRLTHTVLADLVAAQRPTVTSALAELNRRGLVRTVDDGWLLSGQAPDRAQSLAAASMDSPR
jgi:CRP/FNR family transcriptional regulator, cyclic AMP receptor protein